MDNTKPWLARPKDSGLWVSYVTQDGRRHEGVMANDLLRWMKTGRATVVFRRQRMQLRREELLELVVLGVNDSAERNRSRRAQMQSKHVPLNATKKTA